MSDNIIDFTQRLQQNKINAERPVPIPEYDLPPSVLVMDPALQLHLLVGEAAARFAGGELNASKLHRMFTLMQYIYEGVSPQFDLKSKVTAREYPNEDGLARYSVYAWGTTMGRIPTNPDDLVDSVPEYQIDMQLTRFDDDMVIDKGTIYPEDWMTFDLPENSVMTKRFPRHIIKKMNNLVRINGGFGTLVETGYVVVIPYSGQFGLMIVFGLKNQITLIPEEERKKPE